MFMYLSYGRVIINCTTLIDILTSDDFDTQEDLESFRAEDVFRH